MPISKTNKHSNCCVLEKRYLSKVKFFLEIWMLCILFLYAMNDLQFYWKILFYATELPAICIIIFVVLNYIKYIKNENNNH